MRHFQKIAALCIVGAVIAGCDTKDASAPFGLGNSDKNTQQTISTGWANTHPGVTMAPIVTVSNGLVTLTGMLGSAKDRIDAVRTAWQPQTVLEVVNQLQIPEEVTKTSRRDRAMAIKLRSRLTFDTDISSTHYSIEVLDGVVYLMGFTHTDAELARVKQLAEDTAGKGKVVSYVEIRPVAN